MAELVDDKTVWPATGEDSLKFVPEWIDAGARIVGGCCGTNFDHYRALVSVAQRNLA
jgi:S-methylmethionine-dependent homocysteine/selenocysteine methylase